MATYSHKTAFSKGRGLKIFSSAKPLDQTLRTKDHVLSCVLALRSAGKGKDVESES